MEGETLKIGTDSNVYVAKFVGTGQARGQQSSFFGEAKSLSEAVQKVESLVKRKEEFQVLQLVAVQLVGKKTF